MNSVGWIGVALAVIGLAGYAVGTTTPYTGRAFSITAVMIGVTLAAIAIPGAEEP
jgi:hypothetical protein